MADDWIPIRINLRTDHRVHQLTKALAATVNEVLGGLFRFWSTASELTANGFLHGVDAEWVDVSGGIPGLANALAKLKPEPWLYLRQDGIEIPRFDEWLSNGGKARLKDAKRKKEERAGASEPRPKNVQKKPDTIRTREEGERERKKRRDSLSESEDVSRGKSNGHDSHSHSPASPDPPARSMARMHWLAGIDPLFSRDVKQRLSDKTSAERMFDEVIWPEDGEVRRCADAYRKALEFIKRSSGRGNRMAWITKVLNEELA